MSEPKKENCKNCRFSRDDRFSTDIVCVRHAPTVNNNYPTIWPLVSINAWCGEFEYQKQD